MPRRKKTAKPPAPSQPPTIHQASLEAGPSGAVLRGDEVDEAAAIARRKEEADIVVCGDSVAANRRLAQALESAVGPCERQEPHDQLAGPKALPHFQQRDRTHKGHSFYETEKRKSKRQR